MPKPSFDDIKDLYDAIKSDWGDLEAQDKDMQSLFDMTYLVPHPEPEIEGFDASKSIIRSGWTTDGIEGFVALFAEKPVASHEPGVGAIHRRLSERLEAMLNTLPWALEAVHGAFWSPAVENCGNFGRGWVETLPKRKRWVGDPDYPQKGKGTDPETGKEIPKNEKEAAYKTRREKWKKDILPPVSIRNIPADSVYAIVTEQYRVLKAVRYAEITLAQAYAMWPDKFGEAYNDPANKPTDEVKCYEYVDEEWCAQAAEYEDIKELVSQPWPHHMGVCPWSLVEGLTTASTDPNKRWVPWLRKAKDVGIEIDSILTTKAINIQTHPMPQPVIEIPGPNPDSPEKSYELIELSPPKAVILYDGATMHIEGFPDLSPEAETLLEQLNRAKDRLLPDVGAEIAEGSAGPAWNWRLRGQERERDMAVVVDNLSLSAKRIFQNILRALLSKWINETVYIGTEGKEGRKTEQLGPKDIVGQINRINATVKTSTLIDRNQDLGAMKMAVEEPLKLGRRWSGENIGHIENIEEVLEEALLEELEFSDEFKNLLLEAMLEEADLLKQQEAAVPPNQLVSQMGLLPPSAQLAAQRVMGTMPGMQGLGASGVPQGGHPTTMTRSGVAGTGGAKPTSPLPGGAEVIPTA